jgi:UDP-N-acetylmuramoyl-L-alanyl-D-glutamate--2,6-diaminopimelate ligase
MIKPLQDILYKVSIRAINGNAHMLIAGLYIHATQVVAGGLFVAIKGASANGHSFINEAIANGATAIVCEELPSDVVKGITYIQVNNSAAALGIMAHHFYDQPSEKLQLVGVTGTNGKTTIATLLYKLFTSLGHTCGLISTVQNYIATVVEPATHTTPDAITLNALLSKMVAANCKYVFIENSSHAIHQHRIEGLTYAGGVFTNITHDHLDYHKTFDEYIRVKQSFFTSLPATAFAISNADDKRGEVMLQNTSAKKYYYSLKRMVAYKGKIVDNTLAGLVMAINNIEVHFRLIGTFNAYNLLAVYGTAMALQQDREEVLTCLSTLTGAEGRFDCIFSAKENIIGIVDYAHTPDALINVLTTIQQLKKGYEQLITVVGCGGNRDTTKRPLMAAAAGQYSDKLIITSDNPRNEPPEQIVKEMEAGLNTAGKRKTITILDRREAIKTAISLAKAEDIVLVAGKGHEQYQEIKGIKYPFNDKEELMNAFQLLEK